MAVTGSSLTEVPEYWRQFWAYKTAALIRNLRLDSRLRSSHPFYRKRHKRMAGK